MFEEIYRPLFYARDGFGGFAYPVFLAEMDNHELTGEQRSLLIRKLMLVESLVRERQAKEREKGGK